MTWSADHTEVTPLTASGTTVFAFSQPINRHRRLLIARTVAQFHRHPQVRTGPFFALATVTVIGGFLTLSWRTDRWMAGLLGILAVAVLIEASIWIRLYWWAWFFKSTGSDAQVDWQFDPGEIRYTFGHTSAQIRWEAVRSLVVAPGLWILRAGQTQIYLPLADVPFECQRLILDRIYAVGAKLIVVTGGDPTPRRTTADS